MEHCNFIQISKNIRNLKNLKEINLDFSRGMPKIIPHSIVELDVYDSIIFRKDEKLIMDSLRKKYLMEKEIKKLKSKIKELENALYYAPGNLGAKEAQEHFELIQHQIETKEQ